MQQTPFVYEERNEDFPLLPSPRRANPQSIGKILSRYQMKTPTNNDEPSHNHRAHHSVHAGTALNYSQIYNDLKIDKASSFHSREGSQAENAESGDSPRNRSQVSHGVLLRKQLPTATPYHFQSSGGIASRIKSFHKKVLPSLNENTSFEQFDTTGRSGLNHFKTPNHEGHHWKASSKFRINEVKDQSKRVNYQEVSDLYVSENEEDDERRHEARTEAEISARKKQVGKFTDRSNRQKQPQREWEEKGTARRQYTLQALSQREDEPADTLGKSRSIGVGNHKIKDEDLIASFHEESLQNSPRVRKPSITHQVRSSSQKSAHFNAPAERTSSMPKEVAQVEEQVIGEESAEEQVRKEEEKKEPSISKQVKQKSVDIPGPIDRSKIESRSSKFEKVIVHFPEVDAIDHPTHHDQATESVHPTRVDNNQSHVASTIKAVEAEGQDEKAATGSRVEDELDLELLEFENKHQPQEETPQKIPQPEDYIAKFSIEQYTQVYPVLKSIQGSLKSSLINVQEILRGIKKYLEIIAAGNLDNIDDFDLALHKKKIIKNSLFFERVAIIVLAFTYTSHTIKESHKFLLNIIGYSLNNSLILVKVLEETQIGESLKKSSIGYSNNPVVQKSDRLAMKRNLDTLRNNNDVLLDSIQKLSKSQEVFYDNLKQIIKVLSRSSLEQAFYDLLEYFSFYLCVSELDHMIPFLAVAPNPYMAPSLTSKYTLVIDVLELFCLGTKKSRTNVFRPYSQHFLHEMSQYYDIVSFCPAFPNQVDKVIDMLDPKGYIHHRLYKHHAINKNKISLKEVERIGRNMNEVLLLDNENGGGQGSFANCINVPSWKGSKNDTILAELCPLLAMISLKRVPVPEAVAKVREQSLRNRLNGVKYINFGVTLD